PVRSKLLPCAVEGFLVGYGKASNQYRFWILSKHRVIISQDFKLRLDTLPSTPIVETIDDVTNRAPLTPNESVVKEPSPSGEPSREISIPPVMPELSNSTHPVIT